KYGINGKTGRGKLKAYLENPDDEFPVKRRGCGQGHPKLLQEEHTKFILDFFGKEPEKDMFELQTAINIMPSRQARVSQKIKVQPGDRYTEQAKDFGRSWPSRDAFVRNSVFIDEAGFNLSMRRLKGWAPRGRKGCKANVEDRTAQGADEDMAPKLKSLNLSVIGAICWDGIIDMTLRTPPVSTLNKKRSATGKTRNEIEEEEYLR
ncbi:hypothetical protein BGZ83_003182, partial [Gryganskiella cystojenkinii]